MAELKSDRLLLRQWSEKDLPLFAELNSDLEVMEYFPSLLSRKESDAMANKCKSLISEKGWGFWALELKSSGEFIGFVGLNQVKPTLPFSPSVEIGWRLLRNHWGNGYALEAAFESLRYAFETLHLSEVVSFATASNSRSRSVMSRLGLRNTEENFCHPDISKTHPLSEHVLYKITESNWRAN